MMRRWSAPPERVSRNGSQVFDRVEACEEEAFLKSWGLAGSELMVLLGKDKNLDLWLLCQLINKRRKKQKMHLRRQIGCIWICRAG